MALSPKHHKFCEEYLKSWNATDAYQAAYPKTNRNTARANGARLLANASILEEIQRRIDEQAMSANEVLTRLADHARADYKDFIAVADNGDVALDMQRAEGKTHLIKRVSQRRTIRTTKDSVSEETTLSLELHDAQAALVQIGKHHKLFAEQVQHSGPNGGPIPHKVDHGIDGNTATTIFDILTAAGVFQPGADEGKDDGIHPA